MYVRIKINEERPEIISIKKLLSRKEEENFTVMIECKVGGTTKLVKPLDFLFLNEGEELNSLLFMEKPGQAYSMDRVVSIVIFDYNANPENIPLQTNFTLPIASFESIDRPRGSFSDVFNVIRNTHDLRFKCDSLESFDEVYTYGPNKQQIKDCVANIIYESYRNENALDKFAMLHN